MSASSHDVKSTSNQTFLSSLILTSALAAAQLLIFILIRNYFRKVYQPRSYLPSPEKRSDELRPGLFAWIPQICLADSRQIIYKNGLDAYCFIRFLRLLLLIFAPAFLVSWAVLLPVYGATSSGLKSGLDQFTFGNISPLSQNRLPVPLVFAYCFIIYVLYLLQREIRDFINIRQQFLTSQAHRSSARARTVLLTGIPCQMMCEKELARLTAHLPSGGARQIWLVRDLKELPEIHGRYQAAFNKLESGYTNLVTRCYKSKAKQGPAENQSEAEGGKRWSQYLSKDHRPTHRLGFLGLFGQKVDTVDWAFHELVEIGQQLSQAREQVDQFKTQNAAFIEFHTQIGAHLFTQSLAHHQPLVMAGKWVEVAAPDVIWSTLNVKPLEQRVRALISWAITIGLIVFWSFPVAFVGSISNVNSLCTRASWMAWLCRLPAPVPGILQGVLPPVLLAVLFMLLPMVLRKLAVFQAIPLHSLVELSLMSRYFIFLVVHGFLIVTLSSGLMAAIPAITQQPESAVTILANELPKASTFFLTYVVTTCIAGSAGSLLQIANVVLYKLKLKWLASCPRSVYQTRFSMSTVAWGTLFPNICLLAVIGLSYVVVSPILNGFILFGLSLFWFVYKYLFIYVMDLSPDTETGGKFFPAAIKQMFVGLYIGEIFLCGLFFFSQDNRGRQSGVIEGALMVVLIGVTFLTHLLILKEFFPLVDYLPISLAPEEAEAKLDIAGGEGETSYGSMPQTFDKKEVEQFSHRVRYAREDHIGFNNPALSQPLGTIWLAKDDLEISDEAVQDLEAMGIKATSSGARFDAPLKRVFVSQNPPDEKEKIQIPEED